MTLALGSLDIYRPSCKLSLTMFSTMLGIREEKNDPMVTPSFFHHHR